MNSKTTIGFSQFIKRQWLDFAAQRLEQPTAQRRAQLIQFLAQQGIAKSHQQKSLGILAKIWLQVPKSTKDFQQEGLELLKRLPQKEQLAVHWGMIIVIYPFFATVAEQVGRLAQLQPAISQRQIQKRISEKMGERKTVTDAVRQVMQCWLEWGILQTGAKKGNYLVTPPLTLTDSQLTGWLLTSVLIANEKQSAVLTHLINYTPTLFPFKLSNAYFQPNEHLDFFNQGINEASVSLNHYTDY
jgi:hypothetical protein